MQNILLRRALASLLLISLPLPAFALPRERDAWLRAESDHFVFFSGASERSTRRIAVNLERLRDVLVQLNPDLEIGSGRPLNIYVFEDNLALVPYKPLRNGKPANIVGFFLGSQDATYMVMQAEMGMDVERLLYHEFLHYVMGNSYSKLPVWLSEGMAEFYSTFHATDQNAEIGRALEEHIRTLRESNMIPLSQLFAVTYDSRDYNEDYRQGIFYAQSWALVHYLLMGNPARRAQTFQFFQSVAHGAPASESFRSAFQTTEVQIEKELRDYVRRSLFNYAQIPVKPAAELKVRLEPLPRQEALTRLGDLLLYQRDAARFPEAEQHYRAALEAKPGYGLAQAGLCQIQLESGRAAEALACFEKAAKAAPDDAVLQSRYARLLREQGPKDAPTAAKGREALTRVTAQKPDDARVWMELAMTYLNENPMPPEALPAFENAWRLRPDDSWAARNLVTAYVRSGQGDRAARMIETDFTPSMGPLVWETWISEMSQQANRLVIDQKGEEALAILEEIVRRAPADQTREVAEQLPELRRVTEHNRFAKRYNEAVALLQQQKVEEAHVILQELVATTRIPEDAETVRKLAGEVEAFLKKRPKKR
jgi:predicted Zn-dependent protease